VLVGVSYRHALHGVRIQERPVGHRAFQSTPRGCVRLVVATYIEQYDLETGRCDHPRDRTTHRSGTDDPDSTNHASSSHT